jgi:putative transposase
MSRYRLEPTPEQEAVLLRHCSDARYVWNLCVEQESWWQPGRGKMPTWVDRGHQLTEARAEFEWLRAGSQMVQQTAIRDHRQAMRHFFNGTHRRPTWRKAGQDEGFGIAGASNGPHAAWRVRRLSRNIGEVCIPKVGWVRFRWSRAVPEAVKSFRVTRDRASRWHVAFAVIPDPIPAPGNGEVVGIDRGVKISAALSTGEMRNAPRLTAKEHARLLRLERKLARAKPGSNRRARVKAQKARLNVMEVDRRKDWAEKTSTEIARRFDLIRVENLKIKDMTRSARGTLAEPGRNVAQKRGLNREIQKSGWGILVRRLEDKAPGRVEKIRPHFTSRCCSACGHVDKKSRKSQADFLCTACGYACNADVNAAVNIAAGHAVTARGGSQLGPLNREPQLLASLGEWLESPLLVGRMSTVAATFSVRE